MNSTDKKEIRKFGLVALLFFGALCGLGVWSGKAVPVVVFGLLGVLGALFILFPAPMRPVHAGWLKLAHFIGRCVTVVLMVVAYYSVITPAGLLKRVFGGAPLPLTPDRSAETYWKERSEPVQPVERFTKRF